MITNYTHTMAASRLWGLLLLSIMMLAPVGAMAQDPATASVSDAAGLKTALEGQTATTITVAEDITLTEWTNAGAAHTISIADGKKLTFSGNGGIGDITNLTITGGSGSQLVCNRSSGYNLAGKDKSNITLTLTNITVNVTSGGISVLNVIVGNGATINLSSTNINSGTIAYLQSLTVESGGTININNFNSVGISLSDGTMTIKNGGTVKVGEGTGENKGINVGNAASLVLESGGTLAGIDGTQGNIYLAADTKVTGMSGKLNDQGKELNTSNEVTVGAADATPSATALSEGNYTWNGSLFAKTDPNEGWKLENNALTISSQVGMTNWMRNGLSPDPDENTVTSVTISGNVTTISTGAFAECSKLTGVTITATVTSIERSAFRSTALTSFEIPASVTSISELVFVGAPIQRFTVASGSSAYKASNDSKAILTKNGQTLVAFAGGSTGDYEIPTGVTTIGPSSFFGCQLTSVVIPAAVTSIGKSAFQQSPPLTTVTFKATDANAITSDPFTQCIRLTTINVPTGSEEAYKAKLPYQASKVNPNTSGPITGTDWSLDRNTYVLTVKSDAGITNWIKDGKNAYEQRITSVVFEGSITTIADGAFQECSSLTFIEIPASVTTIKTSAFADCTNLKSVTFLKEEAPTIQPAVFSDCHADLKIYIPQNATGYTGDNASDNWKALASKISQDIPINQDNDQITVPDGSTVIGINGVKAQSVTLGGEKATFENVNTKETTVGNGANSTLTLTGTNNLGAIIIPSDGSLTLTAKEGAKITVTSVTSQGNFTDQTGTVTKVNSTDNTTLLAITPPSLTPEIPHNSSSLTLTLSTSKGATATLEKQDADGNWPSSTPAPALLNSYLRSSNAATVTIDEAGIYRAIVTTTAANGKTTTLYTKPFTVTKESSPVVPPPPYQPSYYTVTLPTVKGATINPAAGDHRVMEYTSLRFTLTLDDDYNQSVPIVTTDRGNVIAPRSDGTYVVTVTYSDVNITISGIVKNPSVANAELKAGSTILARNGRIIITTARPMQARIVALTGQTVRTLALSAGETCIDQLAEGIYIVSLGDGTVKKVIVRK